MTASAMINTLILGGLMGLLGQGLRTVVGLKSMADDARAASLDPSELFVAARLVTSLLIGFLVGMAAALPMDLSTVADWQTLLTIVAAGYAGTDFIEGFISRYLGPKPGPGVAPPTAGGPQLFRATRAATARTSPARAKQVVYDSIHETMPGVVFDDDTELSKLGFDRPSLAGLATLINRRGVSVDTGAVQACNTVGDVVRVVQAA